MYTVSAIPMGTIYCCNITRISRIGINHDIGSISPLPCYVWLLKNTTKKENIIIEAGLPDKQSDVSKQQDKFTRKNNELLIPALKMHGLDISDITCCILTHLHWDTAWGAKHIGNVPILVQQKEIRYAVAPYALDRDCYDLNNEGAPFYSSFYWNMKFLDGDAKLNDDLHIMALPGHTPGSQGVLVNTPAGKIFLAGDIAYTQENLNTLIPSGIRMDSRDAMQTMNRLNRMQQEGITVIPSHDYEAASPFLTL